MDRLFGAASNPLRHLGALGYLFFWLIVASGLYIYIWFDTSVSGAYESVWYLTREQWWLGGVMRSVHRYASDAFMLVVALHIVREFVYGRHYHFRWFTWVSGVPLLWLMLFAGLTGFWLVWDDAALFSAVATTEWFDSLKIFSEPLARNFLRPDSAGDRLFSLFVFLHIGVPLLLLLGMWIHVQRLAHPDTQTSRTLTVGGTLALLVLSFLKPAQLGLPASTGAVSSQISFDWFYLAPHALMYATSPEALWWTAGVTTLVLLLCPWMPHAKPAPVAVVDPENCNGCRRCFADCPYGAISMLPHTLPKVGRELAVVDTNLCASCGICAGACPSATPFRSTERLVSGIDMPQIPIDQLRASLKAQLARLKSEVKIVIFGCDHGAAVRALNDGNAAVTSLLCAGQLPPSFIEFALRSGADGVFIVACPDGGCEFRLGARWLEERLSGERDPYLKPTIDPRRWKFVHASAVETGLLKREYSAFRERLKNWRGALAYG
ncbi:MAG: hydrogenase iron-sulfur subunit [Burkholderiales bacterium]